jgi:hypothetical protein
LAATKAAAMFLALRRWVFGGFVTVPSGNGGKESISVGGASALMNYRHAIGRRPWASFLNCSKKDQCPNSHQSENRTLSKASLFYHLAGNRRAVAVRNVITSVPPFAQDAPGDHAATT